MIDLDVTQKDSVYLRIDCEAGIARELSDFFSFKVPGHQFMPSYRSRLWDGTIKLFSLQTQELYAGLVDYVERFANERKYTLAMPSKTTIEVDITKVSSFAEEYLNVHSGGKKITLHAHQAVAICHAIKNERCLLLSPTASGKSLIIYSLIRYYLDKIPKNKKILVIVPTVSLVEQMVSDFDDYSSENGWDAPSKCHKILAGAEKTTSKRVVVSTWQSLFKQPEKYFEQFGAVFGDECLHPDSKILMADGGTKPIKDVMVGDMVVTTNEVTQKQENKPVIKVHRNLSVSEQMYEIGCSNEKTIRITGNHKVMLKNGEWKRADDLKIGDIINTPKEVTFDDQ